MPAGNKFPTPPSSNEVLLPLSTGVVQRRPRGELGLTLLPSSNVQYVTTPHRKPELLPAPRSKKTLPSPGVNRELSEEPVLRPVPGPNEAVPPLLL